MSNVEKTVTVHLGDEFKRQFKRLAKKYHSLGEDFASFVSGLHNDPYQGTELFAGVRKVRMKIAAKGKGKSGGARVISFNVEVSDFTINITLLTIYDKSEMQSISDSYIRLLLKQLCEKENY